MSGTTVEPRIFRAYDVRGRADTELTPEVARLIGRAYATHLRRAGGAATIVVGRDNRPSSEGLLRGFVEGARASGVDVVVIGLSPSPLLYFAAARWGMAGGCNVTGSHGGPEVNGLKLLESEGIPLSASAIQGLRALIEADDFERGAGAFEERDALPEYVAYLGERFALGRPLTVVADAGHGATALAGPAALERAGCEVVGLNLEPDPGGSDAPADPQLAASMEGLRAAVVAQGADMGVAWDGDGDRLGIVDEGGRRHDPDAILTLLAWDLLSRHPGARVLVDVKVSLATIRAIEAHGGRPVFGPTGHSPAKRLMREAGILLGGEASSHFYFREDYFGFDDAIFGACLIAQLVSARGRPLSALMATLRSEAGGTGPALVTSPELRIPCDDAAKFRIAEECAARFRGSQPVLEIDGARIEFEGGWALVRASNTEPVLSVRLEAETPEAYGVIAQRVSEALRASGVGSLPSELGRWG